MLFGDNKAEDLTASEIETREVRPLKSRSTKFVVNAENSMLVAVRKDAAQDAAISTYLNGGTLVDKFQPFDERNGYTKVNLDASGVGWIKSSLLSEV